MHDLSSQYLYSTNVVHVHVFKLLFFFLEKCVQNCKALVIFTVHMTYCLTFNYSVLLF